MSEYQQVSRNLGDALRKAPKTFRKYRNFADDIWSNGVLDKKTKEILAVAVTHVTKCSYCVDYHTKKAKIAGATLPELIEAAVLSASIQAKPLDETTLKQLPEIAQEFFTYPLSEEAFYLDSRTKVLLGLSVSYCLKNSHSVSFYLKQAQEHPITEEEIQETQLISSALLAGATIRHIDDILTAYGE